MSEQTISVPNVVYKVSMLYRTVKSAFSNTSDRRQFLPLSLFKKENALSQWAAIGYSGRYVKFVHVAESQSGPMHC